MAHSVNSDSCLERSLLGHSGHGLNAPPRLKIRHRFLARRRVAAIGRDAPITERSFDLRVLDVFA
jgi:hypothetical protein